MTPIVHFEPIAAHIARGLDVSAVIGTDKQLEAEPAPADASDDQPAWPPVVARFFAYYSAVSRAAFSLLRAPHFERLAKLFERIEEEFMPGGPPMSPIYDSYSIQHVLAEVPVGTSSETPFSVLARLLSRSPERQCCSAVAAALAQSHFDLFRVTRATPASAELTPLRGGKPFQAHLTGPFLRNGDRALARVIRFEGEFFIVDSPYLLNAGEQDWHEYLGRVTQETESALSAASHRSARAASKLTSKQKARLKDKHRAATPEQVAVKHLRFGVSDCFWLDYVVDAYAGERNGIVFLAGVPDRPELLPHSEHYVPKDDAAHPAAGTKDPNPSRFRTELAAIAKREGLTDGALSEWSSACTSFNLGLVKLEPNEESLFAAYCTLGARNAEGLTALEVYNRTQRGEAADQATEAQAIARGWFSMLRIDRIHLDSGLEVFDILRHRKLHISERSATRQVSTASLLMGWVTEDEHGAFSLEGGLCYVLSRWADPMVNFAKALRDDLRATAPKTDWRTRASALPLLLMAAFRCVQRDTDMQFNNMSGERLQFATARYAVRDEQRVRNKLSEQFPPGDDDSWLWLDAESRVLATFVLEGQKLLVRVNSVERLQNAQRQIEQALGSAVQASLSSFEGASSGEAERGGGTSKAMPIPREVLPQVHAMVLAQIRAQFDNPIQMFKGKTLRQLARGPKSRADAVSWLREQERLLTNNPQFEGMSLRPLWEELGLEYQGLETD